MNTIQTIITLGIAFLALISAGIGVVFGIKTVIKSRKDKTAAENWLFIMTVAKAAMSKAEESGAAGKDKKAIVIDAVKAACAEAGINADDFMDQLSAFIDNMIDFANTIK